MRNHIRTLSVRLGYQCRGNSTPQGVGRQKGAYIASRIVTEPNRDDSN